MICRNCGKNIPDSNKFCMYCGTKMEIYSGAPIQSGETDGFSSYQQPRAAVQPQHTEKLTPVATAPVQQPVRTAPQPQVQTQTPSAPGANMADTVNTLVYQMQSENRKNKFLLILVGILIAVIAGGVGAFFALGGPELFEKEEESTTVENTTDVQQNQLPSQGDYNTIPSINDMPTTQYPDTTYQPTIPPAAPVITTTQPTDKHITSSGLEMPAATNYVGICEAYNKAVNDYRAFKGTVTLHRVEDISLEITDLPEAAKPLEGTINSIVSNIVKPVDETFTFSNGVDVNDPARYIDYKMIPFGRDAAVTPSDLVEAGIVENADGGYTITVKFVAETSTYDGTNTVEPVHHMAAMDPLNLATIDISPLEILSAEMTYPGATVSITVDGQGRLVKLTNSLPLEGQSQGGMGFIKTTIGLAGQMDSTYEMTYMN